MAKEALKKVVAGVSHIHAWVYSHMTGATIHYKCGMSGCSAVADNSSGRVLETKK